MGSGADPAIMIDPGTGIHDDSVIDPGVHIDDRAGRHEYAFSKGRPTTDDRRRMNNTGRAKRKPSQCSKQIQPQAAISNGSDRGGPFTHELTGHGQGTE